MAINVFDQRGQPVTIELRTNSAATARKNRLFRPILSCRNHQSGDFTRYPHFLVGAANEIAVRDTELLPAALRHGAEDETPRSRGEALQREALGADGVDDCL